MGNITFVIITILLVITFFLIKSYDEERVGEAQLKEIAQIYDLTLSENDSKKVEELLLKEAGIYRLFQRSLDKLANFKVIKNNGELEFINDSSRSEVIVLISIHIGKKIISQKTYSVKNSVKIKYPSDNSFYINTIGLKIDAQYFNYDRFNKFKKAKKIYDENQFRYDDYTYLLEKNSYTIIEGSSPGTGKKYINE